MKYELQEKEEKLTIVDSLIESIMNVCRALGAKVKPRKRRSVLAQVGGKPEVQPAEAIIAALGGVPGTVIEKR